MVEEISSPSDRGHVPRETPIAAPDNYLEDGLKSGVFDASPGTCKELEFLKGFEIISAPAQNSPGGELPDNADACQRRDFLANPQNRQSVEIKSLWDKNNRVLAIGDQHLTTDIKQFTAENMRAFKEAGADAIGLELFRKEDQHVLDTYRNTRLDANSTEEERRSARAAVESLLRQSQEGPVLDPNVSPDDLTKMRQAAQPAVDATMQMIDSAIDAGIKPIAIEPNIANPFASTGGYDLMQNGMRKLPADAQNAFQAFTSPNSTPQERADARKELERQMPGYERSADFLNTVDKARSEGFDFSGLKVNDESPASQKAWNARLHDFRNKTWSDETAKFLNENPNSRMLLFAGTQHFRFERMGGPDISSANERVKEKGFGTTVLQFTGGDFAQSKHFDGEMTALSEFYARENGLPPNPDGSYPAPPDNYRSTALRYTRVAQEARVAEQQFAFRIKPTGPREADYIVHLKQND